MKAVALLAALPLAAAFVPAPSTRVARGRSVSMNYGYETGERPVGGVQFFPDSSNYWDPLGLAKDEETLAKYQSIEIKHGRIAMLAVLHYVIVANLGIHLPGDLGGVPTTSIPFGYTSTTVLPAAGIAQILLFCSALEVLAPQKEDKVPGNTQPDTPAFNAPGDGDIRTKEINNGRLAMIAIAGIWAGEAASGGLNPFDAFASWVKGTL